MGPPTASKRKKGFSKPKKGTQKCGKAQQQQKSATEDFEKLKVEKDIGTIKKKYWRQGNKLPQLQVDHVEEDTIRWERKGTAFTKAGTRRCKIQIDHTKYKSTDFLEDHSVVVEQAATVFADSGERFHLCTKVTQRFCLALRYGYSR